MTTFRANLPDVFEDRQAEIFFKRLSMEPLRYPEVFNVRPWSKGHVDAFKVSGLGNFVLKPEGQPITYSDPVQGPRVRRVIETFGQGFRVTMEAREDDQFDIIDQMPADLGDSGRDHQERLAWNVINSGVAGGDTGLDGQQLFSTAHVNLRTGTTQSNLSSPGVALSVTGLEAVITQQRLTTDAQDRFTPIEPKQLLIHPDNSHNAIRLLDSQQEPFTTENQVNPVRTSLSGIMAVSVPYLTDTDAYTLVAAKTVHDLTWYNRKSMTFEMGGDQVTKDRLHDGHYRAQVSHFEWRGVNHVAP
jgi:hypothetical protein